MRLAKQAVKKLFASAGIEIMTSRGRRDLQSGHLSTIDEYLGLLARTHGAVIPDNKLRIGLLANLVGAHVGEGAHLVLAINEVKGLGGDVCECGVGSGAMSALLANELRHTGKRLWLYDTFSGLPAPTEEDRLIDDIDGLGSMRAYEGQMAHGQEEVRTRLLSIDVPEADYVIVAGLFDHSVQAQRLPATICFAYIDFDFYAPIKLALEVLSARLVPGGILVVDDYGFFSEGAQTAVDEFMAQHGNRFDIEIPDFCHDRFAILRSRKQVTAV
jgi:O-methyltransferase